MKRLMNILAIGAIALAGAATATADDKDESWIDFEKCAVCKHVGQHKELLTKVKCETHIIDNGMLTVVTIPDEYKDEMKTVHNKMNEAIEKVKSGEKAELCGFCQSYAKLLKAGAKCQEIETSSGAVSLLTSDQPEVVAQIKEHAQKAIKEHEKHTAQRPSDTQHN